MIILIGLLIVAIALFTTKEPPKATATRQRIAVVVALTAEVVAVILGYFSGNDKSLSGNCYATPASQSFAWILAIIGIVAGLYNLYFSIKGKVAWQIAVASLFVLICVAGGVLASFLSVFCFTL